MLSSIKSCPSSKLIFHQRSSSIGWSHIWVIGTRTGKKLMKCYFFLREKLVRTDKSKNILAEKIVPNKIIGFRRNLGCARYAQSWVFFQNVQNTLFLLLYYSACKKATGMVFIRGERGYLADCFE